MEDQPILPIERVEQTILFIRGKKVVLDIDLAVLYGVETKNLNRAVKRNLDRFPEDFMFQLTEVEAAALRFQNGTSNLSTSSDSHRGGRTYLPYAFTEQGIAMLSGVLRSPRAVLVNIAIMRAFVQMRQAIEKNVELSKKIDDLEHKYSDHDEKIEMIFAAIRELMTPPEPPKHQIGFK